MSLLLDQQLCFALYSAQRALTRAYATLLEPLGLTYPQYLVCLALWEREDLAVNELGGCLGLDSGTLTPLLKRMEQAGLVERTRSATDERVVQITLTRAGKALRAKAIDVPKKLAKLVGIEGPRIGALRDELTQIAAALTQPS